MGVRSLVGTTTGLGLMTESLLEWRDDFLIGVEELDFEHMDLFRRLNELERGIAAEIGKARIDDDLDAIELRVEAHFALEEKFMRETRFPGFVAHKREHDKFLDEIRGLMDRFAEAHDPQVVRALFHELQRWIIHHVVESDLELAKAVVAAPR